LPNLLITGGAGFIGSNFTHYWLAHHPADLVVVLDALTYAGNRANLEPALSNPRLTFVHGDIRDQELVEGLIRSHGIASVVHFAAESHVDRSIARPDPFLETNVLGTHELLKAAARVWTAERSKIRNPRLNHVSTDEVYGSLGPDDPPFTEESPYRPSSPYAASKAASDHLVRAYHRTYGFPVVVTNSSNNYGPYQFPEKLIPLTLVQILEGKSVPVYGDGLQVRDWLYVEDHCRALESVMASGVTGETYNIGGGSECTNLDLLQLLMRLLEEFFDEDSTLARRFPRCPARERGKSLSLIAHVPDRPGHDRRYAISNDKIARQTGFEPQYSLEGGLRSTLKWYLEHEDWWRAVMDGRYREWMRHQHGSIVSF
jgi:dTDP-glucose 4,6-dehydratase